MDDQGIDGIIAEVMGDGSTPDAPASPVEADETLGLQDATQVDHESPVEAVDPDSGDAEQPVPFETLQQQWAERETELTSRLTQFEQQKAEQEAALRRTQQMVADAKRRQDEEAAGELYHTIANDFGEEYAQQYWERRNFIAQERDAAWQRVGQVESALDAWVRALEHDMPDQVAAIKQRAETLLQYSHPSERERVLQQERERAATDDAEKAALREELANLRLQLEAQARSPLADAVDGSRSGSNGQSWQHAPDFDSQFDAWAVTELPRSWSSPS